MDTDMHENLGRLDQLIEQLDPSPAELLILFNHLVGRLAVVVDEHEWLAGLDRAAGYLRETRAGRP